ncbi:GMC family oxidoreductase N-terminal domain-containing protein [Burkholderia seminalis]|uniref:GMC family oxidoreductase N-terminal domain-containing protein n=1 Tax=Burkholderia seminalis TaxID=488731 RepID=UPI003C7CC015
MAPARKRPNLTVMTNCTIDRVAFSGRQATGVVGSHNGRPATFRGREIMLSGGVLNSPMILQRSGIGPAALGY